MYLSRTRLSEGKEINPDGTTSCGVFLPLPYNLAKDFPDKSEFDDSVPHFTILYVGDLSPEAYKVFVNLVRKFAFRLKSFECDLSHYSEFMNRNGQKIAHMTPGCVGRMKLAQVHGMLRRYIERWGKQLGVEVKHDYGPGSSGKTLYELQFKPHATLDYLPAHACYKGPKPTGSWTVNELECWGHEQVRIPLGRTRAQQPLGLTRLPLMMGYPRAVPDVERVAESSSRGVFGKTPYHRVPGGSGASGGDIGLAGSLPNLEVQKKIDKLQRRKLRGLK